MSKPARKKIQSPFAKNLKAVLVERGLSQKAAAEAAQVTPATINDWLSGSIPSDPLAVQRLCRALGCSFEWLLTGTDTKSDLKGISLTELFESESDPMFNGIFEISARRLRRKS